MLGRKIWVLYALVLFLFCSCNRIIGTGNIIGEGDTLTVQEFVNQSTSNELEKSEQELLRSELGKLGKFLIFRQSKQLDIVYPKTTLRISDSTLKLNPEIAINEDYNLVAIVKGWFLRKKLVCKRNKEIPEDKENTILIKIGRNSIYAFPVVFSDGEIVENSDFFDVKYIEVGNGIMEKIRHKLIKFIFKNDIKEKNEIGSRELVIVNPKIFGYLKDIDTCIRTLR